MTFGESGLFILVEEDKIERFAVQLLKLQSSEGGDLAFVGRFLLLLFSKCVGGGWPVPSVLAEYIAGVLGEVSKLRDPGTGNAAAVALNLLPSGRGRGRPEKPEPLLLAEFARIGSFSAARKRGLSHVDALEIAADECGCDRRTIERAWSKWRDKLHVHIVESESGDLPDEFETAVSSFNDQTRLPFDLMIVRSRDVAVSDNK